MKDRIYSKTIWKNNKGPNKKILVVCLYDSGRVTVSPYASNIETAYNQEKESKNCFIDSKFSNTARAYSTIVNLMSERGYYDQNDTADLYLKKNLEALADKYL